MKVSVIIPVYNVEQYIDECLDSVLSQTLDEIEVICINDGSTDYSLELLYQAQKKDDRIKVISQENCGLSCARNKGLLNATGEYVLFVDSDDSLSNNKVLAVLYTLMENSKLDIISFNLFKDDTKIIEKRESNIITTGKKYMTSGKFAMPVWLRMYNKKMLNSMNFNFVPGIIHEDVEAIVRLYSVAKKVMHIDDALYKYRVSNNNDTITKRKKSFVHVQSYIQIIKTYNNLFKNEIDGKLKYYYIKRVYDYLLKSYKVSMGLSVAERKIGLIMYEQVQLEIKMSKIERYLYTNEEKYILSGNCNLQICLIHRIHKILFLLKYKRS